MGTSTTTYIDPNGVTRLGVITDGQTYDDKGERVPIGSKVSTDSGWYQLTEDGSVKLPDFGNPKSILNGLSKTNDTSSFSTALSPSSSYYSSNAGQIGDYYDSLIKANNLKIQQSVNSGVSTLQDALNAALPDYQKQRETADYQTAENANTLKESLATMGDRGGMARQDILQNQTAGQNTINSVTLQEQKLKDDTAKQISDLITNGSLQAAIEAAQYGAEKIKALTDENTRLQDANYQVSQDAFNNSIDTKTLALNQKSTDASIASTKLNDDLSTKEQTQNVTFKQIEDAIEAWKDRGTDGATQEIANILRSYGIKKGDVYKG